MGWHFLEVVSISKWQQVTDIFSLQNVFNWCNADTLRVLSSLLFEFVIELLFSSWKGLDVIVASTQSLGVCCGGPHAFFVHGPLNSEIPPKCKFVKKEQKFSFKV